jgi:hypothetical protein
MTSDPKFIFKFIADSVAKEKDPLEAAKEEIAQIDQTLKEAELLKIRRMKLISVLDHFGDESHRRRRAVSVPVSGDIETSDEIVELQQRIKKAIEENGPMDIHELIRAVGSYDEDILIMRAVKGLGDREIVSRDEDGRVQPGKNW